jgi:pSer/pThr/pTyr-binding forkhead associated (FHA) protein
MSIDDLFSISGPRMVVAGAPIPLPRQHEVLVGRVKPGVSPQPDVDLVVHGGDLAGVSRQHARLVRGLEGWFVEDLHSTNGTFVNGVEALPGQRVRLRSGDYVRFGHLTLLFYEE